MSATGTNAQPVSGPELLVELRREAGGLRVQVEQGLRDAIRARRLAAGSRLPATRVLATDLGVSRRLVSDAYEQLRAEGWLQTRPGAGTWVAAEAAQSAAGRRPAAPPSPPWVRYDFFPGVGDLSSFPRAMWLRALRDAIRELPDAELGYSGDHRGPESLRVELGAYLRRARGLIVDPELVIVCAGAMQAVSLLARVLVRSGRTRIAIEDPSLKALSASVAHSGAELVPIAVDSDGIDTAALGASRADAVLVTPAHQFPTGVPLTPARRSALVEWAADGHLVIEDDYNAEFRYDRPAIGALQALAPDRVVHVGTVSKTLAPGLRLGWMVLPPELFSDVLEARTLADGGPPVIDSHALARLLATGAYDRHLRGARRRYQLRRGALAAALQRELPGSRIMGAPGGLHAPVRLPQAVDADDLTAACLARDTAVYPMNWFQSAPPATTDTLVLGYGNLTEPAIAEGVSRLGAALRAITR